VRRGGGAARAQQTPLSPVSSIRVTGDARVTAKPDRVQIDIGVTTRAAQSQDAASQNARQVDAVARGGAQGTGPRRSSRPSATR